MKQSFSYRGVDYSVELIEDFSSIACFQVDPPRFPYPVVRTIQLHPNNWLVRFSYKGDPFAYEVDSDMLTYKLLYPNHVCKFARGFIDSVLPDNKAEQLSLGLLHC